MILILRFLMSKIGKYFTIFGIPIGLITLSQLPIKTEMTLDNSFCPSALFLKAPCPGCGASRSTYLTVNGHFYEALMMNPLGLIFTLGLIGLWGVSLWDVTKPDDALNRLIKRIIQPSWWVLVILFLLMFANWLWNVDKFIPD